MLEKEDEIFHLRNHNQYMMEQVNKLNKDEKSQEEMCKKLKNDNKLLENKLKHIQKKGIKTLRSKNLFCWKRHNYESNPYHNLRGCKSSWQKSFTEIKPIRHYKHDKGK